MQENKQHATEELYKQKWHKNPGAHQPSQRSLKIIQQSEAETMHNAKR